MGRLASSKQTATWDTLSYWLVNLSSAFLLSASHNVLYFVLNIRTPVIHFLHNFNTFILLLICQLVANPRTFGRSASDKLDQKSNSLPRFLAVLLPPTLLQVLATTLSSKIHSQHQSGSLYLLRLFDCLTTIVALKMAPKFLGVGTKNRPMWNLMLPIALGASLSWFELTHIEYDNFVLALSPVLSLVQGCLHLIVLKNSFRHLYPNLVSFERFAFYYTGLVSLFLAVPALISYSWTAKVEYDAAWESIDYVSFV
ncbi:hypothetical protein M3Y97_00424700 [Aphelenchoides bicaudatus]|nr:hypothetical protein M3Y97_00424700 [Aphelenchoides bicaudatus]